MARRARPRRSSSRAGRIAAAVVLALLAGGCASSRRRTAAPRATPAYVEPPFEADRSPRHDVRDLPNLGRVDDGLWRSGQPGPEGYASAKALGVRTVVDLRGSKVGPAATRAVGLDLVVVRTGAKRVCEDDVVAFLRVATDPARRPVLVHCASGHDRTGAMVAAYRRVVLGWPAAQALREMQRFGAAPWYRNLVKLVERMDPAAIRARVAAPRSSAPHRPDAPPVDADGAGRETGDDAGNDEGDDTSDADRPDVEADDARPGERRSPPPTSDDAPAR